jgi:hypothetical protein
MSLQEKLARIDVGGVVLILAAFVCLLLALQWGGTVYAWSDSQVWGCLLGFGLILIAFITLQIRLGDRQVVDFRNFASSPLPPTIG